MHTSVHNELRHRGESLVEYPDASFWMTLGGSDGVAALIKDLYRRIEQDDLLREAFPHFNSGAAAPFFMQWFGGSPPDACSSPKSASRGCRSRDGFA
jgi:hypothetical protein